MDDLISRQQAIDALCSVCNALGGGHNCDKTKFVYNAPFDEQVILCPEHYALTMLPSAQPETNCSEIPNNWIPCSERLPEEGEVVLTQAKFKDDVKMAVSSRIDYNYWTTWGTRDINIIAWMPLPEIYQEGGE